MRITHIVKRDVEETKDIFCNKCGVTCALPLKPSDGHVVYYGLVEASITTGALSPVLPDGHRYTFSLCEPCIAEMMKTWLIEPEVVDWLGLDTRPI
jgi:hypothetical protein